MHPIFSGKVVIVSVKIAIFATCLKNIKVYIA